MALLATHRAGGVRPTPRLSFICAEIESILPSAPTAGANLYAVQASHSYSTESSILPIRTQRKHPNYSPTITNYLPSISPIPTVVGNFAQVRNSASRLPRAELRDMVRREVAAREVAGKDYSFPNLVKQAHAPNFAISENSEPLVAHDARVRVSPSLTNETQKRSTRD